jgi:hypothetical protein
VLRLSKFYFITSIRLGLGSVGVVAVLPIRENIVVAVAYPNNQAWLGIAPIAEEHAVEGSRQVGEPDLPIESLIQSGAAAAEGHERM